jgi:ABC-type uncharacterized transport system ATPase subunit
VVRQDLLRWLKKESETRGATILYATHIFDGLDDWPTHLHYLHFTGRTGWQGRLNDLEMYQQLRAEGYPSPLLRIAETWLRAELEEMKAKSLHEAEDGVAAREESDPLTTPCTSAMRERVLCVAFGKLSLTPVVCELYRHQRRRVRIRTHV